MFSTLAIDTATDRCSVAWVSDTGERVSERILPRAHNRHLLAMITDLLGDDSLSGVEGLVCGVGPGSFTGLRIAVATAQGFAWGRDLPVAGYCSLTAQAEAFFASAMPLHDTDPAGRGPYVLSTIDAQIDQLYGRWLSCDSGSLRAMGAPFIVAPGALALPDDVSERGVLVVGSGATYIDRFPSDTPIRAVHAEARPSAGVMARHAARAPTSLSWVSAAQLQPAYVQTEIGWKKLAEQGSYD